MIIGPLSLLALTSAWLEYRAAGSVTEWQDQQLLALQLLLADSVILGGGGLRAAVARCLQLWHQHKTPVESTGYIILYIHCMYHKHRRNTI